MSRPIYDNWKYLKALVIIVGKKHTDMEAEKDYLAH